jgi:hypothetical protein
LSVAGIGHRVPADARAVVESGDRVIAWARDHTGRVLVLAVAAAYLPIGALGEVRRVPYSDIANVTWADPELEVVIEGRTEHARFELDEPGDLPPVLRERVTSSIVISARVDLGEGPDRGRVRVGGSAEVTGGVPGARITARRSPSTDDGEMAVIWHVVFDPGLDPADPALRAVADAAIIELKATTGL